MSEANKYQVSGNHYTSVVMPQHWDVVRMMGWDYFIGNATKYLWRMGKKHPSLKGQLEDLDKAIHYLQKKREILVSEMDQVSMNAAEMGILGIKKPQTIGDILAEMDREEAAKCGPSSGYVNQDR